MPNQVTTQPEENDPFLTGKDILEGTTPDGWIDKDGKLHTGLSDPEAMAGPIPTHSDTGDRLRIMRNGTMSESHYPFTDLKTPNERPKTLLRHTADQHLPANEGAQDFQHLLDGGMALPDASAWKNTLRSQMLTGGMDPGQVASYWGETPPDTSRLDGMVRSNLAAADPAKTAEGPLETLAAGWNMSVASLQQHAPTVVAPEHMGLFNSILYGSAQLAGDAPAIAAGALAGGAIGSAAGPLGTLIGAGAGGAALPQAMRSTLMDHYLKGDIQSFQDFYSRGAGIALDTAKAAVAGGVGGLVGGVGGQVAAKVLPRWAAGTVGSVTGATAATTAGAALDGRAPRAEDLVVGAATVLGMHVAGSFYGATGRFVPSEPGVRVQVNLGDIYTETGVPPVQAAEAANADVAVLTEVVAPRAADGTALVPLLKAMAPAEAPPYEHPAQPEAAEGAAAPAEKLPAATPSHPPQEPAEKFSTALAIQGDAGGGEPPLPSPPALPPAAPEPGMPAPKPNLNELRSKIDGLIAQTEAPEPFLTRGLKAMRRTVAMFQSELTPAVEFDKKMASARGVAFEYADNASNIDRSGADVNLEDMMRHIYAARDQASVFIREGTLELQGAGVVKNSDDSFFKAYGQVEKDGGTLDDFTRYRMALRTVEKAKQGIQTGLDLDVAKAFLAEPGMEAKYAEGNRIMQRVKNAAIDWAVDSGRFSKEQGVAFKALNQDHIVFRRAFQADYNPPGVTRGLKGKGSIYRMEGGEGQIVDPVIADIDNLHLMVAMGNRNRAAGYIVNFAEAKGKQAQAAAEMAGIARVRVHDMDTGAELNAEMLDINGQPVSTDARQAFGPLVAERRFGGDLKQNEFLYFRNGKAEVWRVNDPDLADLLKMPLLAKPNDIVALMQTVAGWQRAGLTGRLSFVMRAISHGQFAASASGPGVFMLPYQDILVGIGDKLFDAGRGMEAARANGAIGTALVSIDRDYIKNDIRALWDKTGTTGAVWNVVSNPLEALRTIQHYITGLATTGRFVANVKAGAAPMKASMIASVSHLDFREKQAASWVNQMAKMVTFSSVGIKDIEQLGRAMQERPMATILRSAALITTSAVVLFALNHEADKNLPPGARYSDIPQWERDLYFISPPIMGVRVKWPKPYVAGMFFGTTFEHALRWWADGDPKEFADWRTRTIEQFVPPMVPAIAGPFAEDWANKRLYNGQPIVPASLEKQSDWMQYTADTTATAKGLSRLLGPPGMNVADFSPAMAENWVRNWLGPLPLDALHVLERPFNQTTRPWEASDLPFLGAFTTRHNYGLSAQPVRDFFDASDELVKQGATLKAAIQREGKAAALEGREPDLKTTDIQASIRALGLTVGTDTTLDDLAQDPKLAQIGMLGQMQEAFKRAAGLLAGINGSKMTDAEKRKYTDAIGSNMVAAADAGNRMVKSLQQKDSAGFESAQGVATEAEERAAAAVPQ